jgi:hypothetical protein
MNVESGIGAAPAASIQSRRKAERDADVRARLAYRTPLLPSRAAAPPKTRTAENDELFPPERRLAQNLDSPAAAQLLDLEVHQRGREAEIGRTWLGGDLL